MVQMVAVPVILLVVALAIRALLDIPIPLIYLVIGPVILLGRSLWTHLNS